jgi:hypothetical protein
LLHLLHVSILFKGQQGQKDDISYLSLFKLQLRHLLSQKMGKNRLDILAITSAKDT